MIEALYELPSNLRGRLVASLESGALRGPYSEASVLRALGRSPAPGVVDELESLRGLGLQDAALATWIETSCSAREGVVRPELVWSGPPVPGIRTRKTAEVFEDLLGTAEESIWASTYAYYDGRKAFETLAKRMDEVESLEVTLLMNIQRPHRNTQSGKVLIAQFRERFWAKGWPGHRRPRVFFDKRSLVDDPSERGVLHAKAIVKDQREALVTSANFTEAALERNLEAGLLSRDRGLARALVLHFRRLIERGHLEAL